MGLSTTFLGRLVRFAVFLEALFAAGIRSGVVAFSACRCTYSRMEPNHLSCSFFPLEAPHLLLSRRLLK